MFLDQHQTAVFRFLTHSETIPATNKESEFNLRFQVIARKLSGGRRMTAESVAQRALPSIIRTGRQLARKPEEFQDGPRLPPDPPRPARKAVD